jgi:hypothetical protein
MSLRRMIGLCAIIVGTSSLTLCQPPTPRIAKVSLPTVTIAETKDISTARSVQSTPFREVICRDDVVTEPQRIERFSTVYGRDHCIRMSGYGGVVSAGCRI